MFTYFIKQAALYLFGCYINQDKKELAVQIECLKRYPKLLFSISFVLYVYLQQIDQLLSMFNSLIVQYINNT